MAPHKTGILVFTESGSTVHVGLRTYNLSSAATDEVNAVMAHEDLTLAEAYASDLVSHPDVEDMLYSLGRYVGNGYMLVSNSLVTR